MNELIATVAPVISNGSSMGPRAIRRARKQSSGALSRGTLHLLARTLLLWCYGALKFHDFTILAPPYVKCKSNVHLLSNV